MASSAASHKIYPKLRGVFAVYKPANVSVLSISRKIADKLATDLNSNYPREQKNMVRFLPKQEALTAQDSATSAIFSSRSSIHHHDVVDLMPVNVPDLFDHLAVQGPRYHSDDFEINAINSLDVVSSGVQVFGLQAGGQQLLKQIHSKKMPKRYRVQGRFGVATTKFDRDSKVIHKSTWDHITEGKIKAFVDIVCGSYRNALLENSGLDLEGQLAYDMASHGLLKPARPTGPMILDMKLRSLDLPDFTLDVTCTNENCQFLRQAVDEIGAALRSSAVCTSVHRYKDGIFSAEDESTLLTRDITVQRVLDISPQNFERIRTMFKEDSSVYHDWAEQQNSAS